MARRIPADAFSLYVAMGTRRSYEAVADKLAVSKRAVVDLAARENWQQRVEKIDRTVRDGTDREAAESLSDVATRQGKILRAVVAKSLESLRSGPMPPAVAARTLLSALAQEREVRLMPTGSHVEQEAHELAHYMVQFAREMDLRTMGGRDGCYEDGGDEEEDDASDGMGEDEDDSEFDR